MDRRHWLAGWGAETIGAPEHPRRRSQQQGHRWALPGPSRSCTEPRPLSSPDSWATLASFMMERKGSTLVAKLGQEVGHIGRTVVAAGGAQQRGGRGAAFEIAAALLQVALLRE